MPFDPVQTMETLLDLDTAPKVTILGNLTKKHANRVKEAAHVLKSFKQLRDGKGTNCFCIVQSSFALCCCAWAVSEAFLV